VDAWAALMSTSSIMRAESSLLTTKKILAERIEPFQLFQAKSVIPHFRVGEDLGGCGLTPPAESALLAVEKILAKANQLSYLFALKEVFLRFWGRARGLGRGWGVILLYGAVCLLMEEPANASQLLQPLGATDPQFPAQQDEPLEQTVATLGFEKLA